MGLQIALVGTLAARSDKLQAILVKEPWDVESTIIIAVIVLYCFLLVANGRGSRLSVYVPINPRTDESLIYFEDIAAMDYDTLRSPSQEHERGAD